MGSEPSGRSEDVDAARPPLPTGADQPRVTVQLRQVAGVAWAGAEPDAALHLSNGRPPRCAGRGARELFTTTVDLVTDDDPERTLITQQMVGVAQVVALSRLVASMPEAARNRICQRCSAPYTRRRP